jgi:hypothetical protein
MTQKADLTASGRTTTKTAHSTGSVTTCMDKDINYMYHTTERVYPTLNDTI